MFLGRDYEIRVYLVNGEEINMVQKQTTEDKVKFFCKSVGSEGLYDMKEDLKVYHPSSQIRQIEFRTIN